MLERPNNRGYVQANGRLQCWNSRRWRPQGLVAAAARKLPRGALGIEALTRRPRHGRPNNRGPCRQTAGEGTAEANGRRSILGVVRVWKLANGRLERPNNRVYVQANSRLQRWNSSGWRPQGLVEAAARHGRPNNRVYVQANGRLQRWNSKGRGYVHANGRWQHWNSRSLRPQGLVEALGNVKAMAVTKQVPHLRWSQAPPLPWRRPGSADNEFKNDDTTWCT